MTTIPAELMKDRYWGSLLHIFLNQPKLHRFLTTKFFDMQCRMIHTRALQNASRPWSQSEKFMLQLALHLYNESHKVNLSDMDYLDPNNKKLAFEALQIRFKFAA